MKNQASTLDDRSPVQNHINLSQDSKASEEAALLASKRGIYPIDAPKLKEVGLHPHFIEMVSLRRLGSFVNEDGEVNFRESLEYALTRWTATLLRCHGTMFPVPLDGREKGKSVPATWVSGHQWGMNIGGVYQGQPTTARSVDGPHPRSYYPSHDNTGRPLDRVMVVGKMPWSSEVGSLRLFVDVTGEIFMRSLRENGCDDERFSWWYITNAIKFMPPDRRRTLPRVWLKLCEFLLWQEILIQRPDYILCLGSDALKLVSGDKSATLKSMEGSSLVLDVDMRKRSDEKPDRHQIKVMASIHPAQVQMAKDAHVERSFSNSMKRFLTLLDSPKSSPDIVEVVDHRQVDRLDDARALFVDADNYLSSIPKPFRIVAVDAEWEGRSPTNRGAFLRTIQLSWKDKQAVCLHLRDERGQVCFLDGNGNDALHSLYDLLYSFLAGENGFQCWKRVAGHFLVSDLQFLRHDGFNPVRHCPIPINSLGSKSPWERMEDGEGWIDTGMGFHAIEESAGLGLSELFPRYTTAPRYDTKFDKIVAEYCAQKLIRRADLEGYGFASRDAIAEYGCYDADVTGRLARILVKRLYNDFEGRNSWKPFWESMSIQEILYEMRCRGIQVDQRRFLEMSSAFIQKRDDILYKMRDALMWPSFNPNSLQHVREALFGSELNGKVPKKGESIRLRPPYSVSFAMTPVVDTSKPPVKWEKIVREGKQDKATPGTGNTALSVLQHNASGSAKEFIDMLQNYRVVDLLIRNILQPKSRVEIRKKGSKEKREVHIYRSGLLSYLDHDGCVRSSIYPTARTGRWRSSRPPLQNWSNTSEANLKNVFGSGYTYPLRTLLVPRDGHVFVAADFTGAELYMIGIQSGDEVMIDHCKRASLPESDPKYYDIHSNICVKAFQLSCKPTKQEIAKAGKGHLRTPTKNIVFGTLYGRSARQIAFALQGMNIDIDEDQADAVRRVFFSQYPKAEAYVLAARSRASRPSRPGRTERYVCTWMGRTRRFSNVEDKATVAAFEREAMNHPIQGGIAHVVNRGLLNLSVLRSRLEDRINNENRSKGLPERFDLSRRLFYFALQVHDEVILEVPDDQVGLVAGKLMPYSLSDMVSIYQANLDGEIISDTPYHLGIEVKVMTRWGELISPDECKRRGINTKYSRPIAYAAS